MTKIKFCQKQLYVQIPTEELLKKKEKRERRRKPVTTRPIMLFDSVHKQQALHVKAPGRSYAPQGETAGPLFDVVGSSLRSFAGLSVEQLSGIEQRLRFVQELLMIRQVRSHVLASTR